MARKCKLGKVIFAKVVASFFTFPESTREPVPADMLRYDVGFVHPDHPGIVAFPTFSSRGFGTFGGKFTEARWRSFSTTISEIPRATEEHYTLVLHFNSHHATWKTRKHPRRTYNELIEVSVEQYLDGTAFDL